jgi:transcriptional regulator with XRE-family HTH domain
MDTIGDRLRHFAKTKFGSTSELARQMGLQPQALTAYLSNRTTPGNVTQSKLRELGCDIEWLMTGKQYELNESDTSTASNATAFVKLVEEQEAIIYRLTNEVKMLREEVDEYRAKRATLPR